MAYIYVMYLNSPALWIANGKIHQHSFNSTTLFVDNLEEIIDEDKKNNSHYFRSKNGCE